jgi:hypothetical protein
MLQKKGVGKELSGGNEEINVYEDNGYFVVYFMSLPVSRLKSAE